MQTVGADAQEPAVNRSFLFVPADSERKLDNARHCAADALILDLEDSVAAAERPKARAVARDFIAGEAGPEVWVRINALDTDDASPDLQAVVPSSPTGIVLPKPRGAEDVRKLAAQLDSLEREYGCTPGSIGIMPIATERPAALFSMQEYAASTERLAGLTWGAEDLSAALGASANRDDAGNWLSPYEFARSLCLFAAAAAGVPAIDTVYTDFKDAQGLTHYARAARRDGFGGMLAIHPGQIDIINEAFMPGETELARARRIVELFASNPDAGALGMDGEMIDRPHLLQAQRVLQRAGE